MYKSKALLYTSLFCAVTAAIARAQTIPSVMLQNATLSGSGNTITATNVPVVTVTGTTIYVNLTLQFNADATGNLTVAPGSLSVNLAPALITSSFQPGTYVTGSNTLGGTGSIVIAGPAITDGGATIWTATAATGANSSTYPTNATWYVGPAASSPYAARIKAAGLTSNAFSYGVVGSQPSCCGSPWHSNALIGITQVANTITIVTFSDGAGNDHNLPLDQVTYTLKH